ncbi:MAG: protein-disulfide reductase DsbD family protein [Candidatus Competibacteraceae bacterium]
MPKIASGLRRKPENVILALTGFRPFSWLAVILLAGLLHAFPAFANPVQTPHVQAHLVGEVAAVRPGQPFWVALRLTMRDGWHTYWRNPGDSGLATTIDWTLPEGFTASEIRWPYPERIPVGPLMNFGYHGKVWLLVQIQPPATLADSEPLTLQAHARWLVCEEDCIPEEAVLRLTLPVGTESTPLDPRWSEGFAATRRALPQPNPWPASFHVTTDALTLELDAGPSAGNIADLTFFPAADGIIDHAAPQTVQRDGSIVRLTVARGAAPALPEPLTGVFVIQERLDDGQSAVHAFTLAASHAEPATPLAYPALAQSLLLALLGGVLLNLMPCVFPVLSLKALGLARHAHESPGAVRAHGLAYTAGVLVCFALVAGVLIALRAAGEQIGWGFQLQSPMFVALLAYFMFALALSLSGVFEIGGRLMGIGGTLADRPGYSGSFATGALAVVVATPCTAPFMGAALGFALTQPWLVSLTVFLALGLGLALPYLLLSFSPALLRFLPRPGPWLERGKQLLAFPLYATAAWLVWVLSQQAGPDGVAAALAGMILIAFAIWLAQAVRAAGRGWRLTGCAGAALALVLALGLTRLPATEPESSYVASQASSAVAWEPFSPARLAELQAAGRPVFVNFTAAWCITCLVNERVALSSARVALELVDREVVALKADWTHRDPVITAALADFGRGGVPLYLLYAPQATEPVILPQILTEALVLQNLQTL